MTSLTSRRVCRGLEGCLLMLMRVPRTLYLTSLLYPHLYPSLTLGNPNPNSHPPTPCHFYPHPHARVHIYRSLHAALTLTLLSIFILAAMLPSTQRRQTPSPLSGSWRWRSASRKTPLELSHLAEAGAVERRGSRRGTPCCPPRFRRRLRAQAKRSCWIRSGARVGAEAKARRLSVS